ncbi:MAG: hypothetical protein EOP50_20670, partial [Sphingobacteriales bacterium]
MSTVQRQECHPWFYRHPDCRHHPWFYPDRLQDLIQQTQAVMQSAEASAEQTELSQLIATLENLHSQVAASAGD